MKSGHIIIIIIIYYIYKIYYLKMTYSYILVKRFFYNSKKKFILDTINSMFFLNKLDLMLVVRGCM